MNSAQQVFEREAGKQVRFMKMEHTARGTEFSFRVIDADRVHTIAIEPRASNAEAVELWATRAGRWAKVVADRAMS